MRFFACMYMFTGICMFILLSAPGRCCAQNREAREILDSMLRAQDDFSCICITGISVFPGYHPDDGIRQVQETLYVKNPFALRRSVMINGKKRILLHTGKKQILAWDCHHQEIRKRPFDFYLDILYKRNTEALVKELEALGVDLDQTSLGRWEGKSVFVIGARYPDMTRPQIWIERKTGLCAKIVCQGRNKEPFFLYESFRPDDLWEVQFLSWMDFSGIIHPREIEFYQGGKKVQVIHVHAINPLSENSGGNQCNTLFDENLVIRQHPEPYHEPESLFLHNTNTVNQIITDFARIFE